MLHSKVHRHIRAALPVGRHTHQGLKIGQVVIGTAGHIQADNNPVAPVLIRAGGVLGPVADLESPGGVTAVEDFSPHVLVPARLQVPLGNRVLVVGQSPSVRDLRLVRRPERRVPHPKRSIIVVLHSVVISQIISADGRQRATETVAVDLERSAAGQLSEGRLDVGPDGLVPGVGTLVNFAPIARAEKIVHQFLLVVSGAALVGGGASESHCAFAGIHCDKAVDAHVGVLDQGDVSHGVRSVARRATIPFLQILRIILGRPTIGADCQVRPVGSG
mmetsp:Transcript_50856/g.115596  ORF Transcript_50856/g.115596 Transcript_50856/m.115596 type:complete len:275 (+) Transcript_50856:931-1755(+)